MTTPTTHDVPNVEGRTAHVTRMLETFCATQPDAADGRIDRVRRAGSGRSRDNWFFELVLPDGGREQLILRTDPEGGLVTTDRSVEFAVLRALENTALPTPSARWLDADGRAFGRPSLVMRRLPGTCEYRVLRDTDRPVTARTALARSFCELLAAVHAVDWHASGLATALPDPGPDAALAELDRWNTVCRRDQVEPWPELDYARTVLAEHAPKSPGTVLVHADFKPGNILLDGERVTALLDWELAHLGDPLEDLGWVTQPLRSGEHTIEEAWTAADLVAHYELITGTAVDRDALAWWNAFSAYKTAVMQISGLRAFLDERSEKPYRPTRRVLAALFDSLDFQGARI